jgi:hypothetical protein
MHRDWVVIWVWRRVVSTVNTGIQLSFTCILARASEPPEEISGFFVPRTATKLARLPAGKDGKAIGDCKISGAAH